MPRLTVHTAAEEEEDLGAKTYASTGGGRINDARRFRHVRARTSSMRGPPRAAATACSAVSPARLACVSRRQSRRACAGCRIRSRPKPSGMASRSAGERRRGVVRDGVVGGRVDGAEEVVAAIGDVLGEQGEPFLEGDGVVVEWERGKGSPWRGEKGWEFGHGGCCCVVYTCVGTSNPDGRVRMSCRLRMTAQGWLGVMRLVLSTAQTFRQQLWKAEYTIVESYVDYELRRARSHNYFGIGIPVAVASGEIYSFGKLTVSIV
jgi:hypothetical protein